MMRTRLRFSIIFLVAGVVILGGVLAVGNEVFTRPGPLAQPAMLVVERGAGLNTIARGLHAKGVIASKPLFKFAAQIHGANRNLKAGEYGFEPGASLYSVLNTLRDGRTVARKFTVPEGLTSKEIVTLLESVEGLTGKLTAVPPEGTLLPNTYHFSRGDSRAAIAERLSGSMVKALDELWAVRAPDLPIRSRAEAVILASIVEKETGLSEERPRVAAVFINRLRKGMRLESDPTVVYGLNNGAGPLGRPLTFADLRIKHAYNTYRRSGLPVGPICNPGREALAAVLNPIETDEFFFVADGTGGHVFARTFGQHTRNVARWRKVQRKNRIKKRNRAKSSAKSGAKSGR